MVLFPTNADYSSNGMSSRLGGSCVHVFNFVSLCMFVVPSNSVKEIQDPHLQFSISVQIQDLKLWYCPGPVVFEDTQATLAILRWLYWCLASIWYQGLDPKYYSFAWLISLNGSQRNQGKGRGFSTIRNTLIVNQSHSKNMHACVYTHTCMHIHTCIHIYACTHMQLQVLWNISVL